MMCWLEKVGRIALGRVRSQQTTHSNLIKLHTKKLQNYFSTKEDKMRLKNTKQKKTVINAQSQNV